MHIKIGLLIYFLLCFSITTRAAPFKDDGYRTITDYATGFIWQKNDDGVTRFHGVALFYCVNLSLGGINDWQMPEIKELSSLVDYRDHDIAISRFAFSDTNGASYWSVSRAVKNSTRKDIWVGDFQSGEVKAVNGTVNIGNRHHTRCVNKLKN